MLTGPDPFLTVTLPFEGSPAMTSAPFSPLSIPISIALNGSGWHPAAWRFNGRPPHELFTAGFWTEQVELADAALVDLVTLENTVTLHGGSSHRALGSGRTLHAHFDASRLAARLARTTTRIGLVPAVGAHELAEAYGSLHLLALHGTSRSGWQLPAPPRSGLTAARNPVLQQLSDPAWRPIVTASAGDRTGYEHAAAHADVLFLSPDLVHQLPTAIAQVRVAETAVGRTREPLRVFADVNLVLGDTVSAARARELRLQRSIGRNAGAFRSPLVGDSDTVATALLAMHRQGVSGFRLRPACSVSDLEAVVNGLLPELARRTAPASSSAALPLRRRLGLDAFALAA